MVAIINFVSHDKKVKGAIYIEMQYRAEFKLVAAKKVE